MEENDEIKCEKGQVSPQQKNGQDIHVHWSRTKIVQENNMVSSLYMYMTIFAAYCPIEHKDS